MSQARLVYRPVTLGFMSGVSVENRTYCYMIAGGRPDRADAAQRLPEKTLQSRRFDNRAGTVCFAVRG